MLGTAVASNLSESGFEVIAFNRTKNKMLNLKENGIKIAKSPKEVAEKSELVIIVVKDANAVKQVSFENEGIVQGQKQDLIVADMSTIEPKESKRIAEEFTKYGITKLDIPVMGGPNVAIKGELVMMCSGTKEIFDRCEEVFNVIANKVFFLGQSGTANTIKLAMNLQIAMLALAISEGIMLVKKSDVDPKIFLEILNSTYFKTGMSERKAYKMIEGKNTATFTLANLEKDISTIANTAKDLEIKLPMISKAGEIYNSAKNEGFSDIDYTGIIEYIKKINR